LKQPAQVLEICLKGGRLFSIEMRFSTRRTPTEGLADASHGNLQEAAALTQTAKAVQAALEEACSRSGGLSSDEAATVAELVMEHGDVDVLAELRHALNTICRHGKKLTSSQAGSLAKLLLKHGDVEMVWVRGRDSLFQPLRVRGSPDRNGLACTTSGTGAFCLKRKL
jgi:hypothetical protein